METTQNQNELTDLLERTAKQTILPRQKEEQRAAMQQSKETL